MLFLEERRHGRKAHPPDSAGTAQTVLGQVHDPILLEQLGVCIYSGTNHTGSEEEIQQASSESAAHPDEPVDSA